MPKFSKDELQEKMDSTREIEAKREEKDIERQRKKKQKELKKQRETREKLVGPILLILTIFITLLIKLFFKK
jgi:hypothetical protein